MMRASIVQQIGLALLTGGLIAAAPADAAEEKTSQRSARAAEESVTLNFVNAEI